MVRVTKWLSQRNKVEVGLDELKNLRIGGRPEVENQLYSVSSLLFERMSPYFTVSFQ